MRFEIDPDEPDYREGPCDQCGATVGRWRGESDVECDRCGAQYNCSGQRLRDNWRDNPSNYDDDISDLEGFEMAALRSEYDDG